MQLRKWQSDWEGLAIKIVDTTNENYDASWVQDLIKHRFYSWGGRSSIEVFEGRGYSPSVFTYLPSIFCRPDLLFQRCSSRRRVVADDCAKYRILRTCRYFAVFGGGARGAHPPYLLIYPAFSAVPIFFSALFF